MKYYIVASLSRQATARELAEIGVPGAQIHAGRIKATINADTWQQAMEQGKKMILGCLKSGINASEWGWMPVDDVKKLGDEEVYAKYPNATWLCYYRVAAGLTQEQLAEQSGIHKMQISRIERGEINLENISLANAVALAKALNIRAEDLL